MLFLNGLGAISGPLVTGWLMTMIGPQGFWVFIAVLLAALSAYAGYRMTQRPAPAPDETAAYTPVMMSATAVAVEAAQEWAAEAADVSESEENSPDAA
jgi:MFS family permease